jgi:hypothetical protein
VEAKIRLFVVFDPRSPRISAYDIHEWIHETMRLREEKVATVQIDGSKRQVYVKLREYQRMSDTGAYPEIFFFFFLWGVNKFS